MRRVLLGVLGAFLAVGVGLAPASAESGSVATPQGDAPAKVDITRLTVDNGQRWVTMRVDVRNLRQKGKFGFHYWMGTGGAPPPRSALVMVHRVDGETKARFFGCGLEDCTPDPCSRLRATWRPLADVVRIGFPQRCFPRPAHNPDAPPPPSGRFFAWSRLGDVGDSPNTILTLDRG